LPHGAQANTAEPAQLDQDLLANDVKGEPMFKLGNLGATQAVFSRAQPLTAARGGGFGSDEELAVAGVGRPRFGQGTAQGLLAAECRGDVKRQPVMLEGDARLAPANCGHLAVGPLDPVLAHCRPGRLTGTNGLSSGPDPVALGELSGKLVTPGSELSHPELPGVERAAAPGAGLTPGSAADGIAR
jgi:hypothetical protein